MRIINIVPFAVSALALFSCTPDEIKSPSLPDTEGMLMVRPRLSDMQVSTKAALDQPVYAYMGEELAAGNVYPNAAVMTDGDIYYYQLSRLCRDVVFSNVSASDGNSVQFISREDGSLAIELYDQSSAEIGNDILFGSLGGITAGTSGQEPYSLELSRVSSEITSRLEFLDQDGNPLQDDIITGANITYEGLGTAVEVQSDYTVYVSGSAPLSDYFYNDGEKWTTDSRKIIPGAAVNTCTIEIFMLDGTSRTYQTRLNRLLGSNRSYIVTFRFTKANSSATFELEDLQTAEYNFGAYDVVTDGLFDVREYWYLGSAEGTEISIPVNLNMPYDWDYVQTDGGEWFYTERDGNNIIVRSYYSNDNETRTGTVRITASNGDFKDIYFSQINNSKQTVFITKQSTSHADLKVEGSNIEVDTGNGFQSCESGIISMTSSVPAGTVVTIQADAITSLGCQSYLFSDMEFYNCVSLMDLDLTLTDSPDLSALPSLRSVNLRNSESTDIVFAEDQGVANVIVNNCDNMTALDLTNIAGSLTGLLIRSCDKLESFTVYDSGFTGEKQLKTVRLQDNYSLPGVTFYQYTGLRDLYILNCSQISSLNLSGCTSLKSVNLDGVNALEFLNLSSCSVLDNMRLADCPNLVTVMTDNTYALRSITFGYNTGIGGTLDLSGRTSLREIILEGYFHCDDLNLSGCTDLRRIGSTENADFRCTHLDISGCTSLSALDVDFEWNSEGSLDAENTNLSSLRLDGLSFLVDFSTMPSLNDLYMNSSYTDLELDLSMCWNLKSFEFEASYSDVLKSMTLPQSLEEIRLDGNGGYSLTGSLDFSQFQMLRSLDVNSFNSIESVSCVNLPVLERLDISYCNNISEIDVTGCTSLLDCQLLYCNSVTSIYLDNCQNLSNFNSGMSNSELLPALENISMFGCSSMKHLNLGYSKLTSLDVSGCPELEYLDIGRNEFSAEALDTLFGSLPDRNMSTSSGTVIISGNPGEYSCTRSIALGKMWMIE